MLKRAIEIYLKVKSERRSTLTPPNHPTFLHIIFAENSEEKLNKKILPVSINNLQKNIASFNNQRRYFGNEVLFTTMLMLRIFSGI